MRVCIFLSCLLLMLLLIPCFSQTQQDSQQSTNSIPQKKVFTNGDLGASDKGSSSATEKYAEELRKIRTESRKELIKAQIFNQVTINDGRKSIGIGRQEYISIEKSLISNKVSFYIIFKDPKNTDNFCIFAANKNDIKGIITLVDRALIGQDIKESITLKLGGKLDNEDCALQFVLGRSDYADFLVSKVSSPNIILLYQKDQLEQLKILLNEAIKDEFSGLR